MGPDHNGCSTYLDHQSPIAERRGFAKSHYSDYAFYLQEGAVEVFVIQRRRT